MPMLIIKLREAVQAHKRRTGEKMTYRLLAERTGIAYATLNKMGSDPNYNATVTILAKICAALKIKPGELLDYVEDDPPRKSTRAKRKKRGG